MKLKRAKNRPLFSFQKKGERSFCEKWWTRDDFQISKRLSELKKP